MNAPFGATGSGPVGILGGTGPVATLHLHQRVIERALQRGARTDADFPSMLISSVALLSADQLGVIDASGIAERIEALRQAGCTRIVSACNALASYTDQAPSLPAETLARTRDEHIGVLCAETTRADGLYEDGRDVRYADQAAVTHLIELAMAGMPQPDALAEQIDTLRSAGCTCILLGCTELTVHRPPGGWPADVIDSVDVACDLVMGA